MPKRDETKDPGRAGAMILVPAPRAEAIAHALWEARECAGVLAYCASLAMLRKALDLWSKEFRDRLESGSGIMFTKRQRDNLKARLARIAETNPIHADTIHEVVDALREDANDGVHGDSSCVVMRFHAHTLESDRALQRRDAREVCEHVEGLIAGTMKGVRPAYESGDPARAREVSVARNKVVHARAKPAPKRRTLKPPSHPR